MTSLDSSPAAPDQVAPQGGALTTSVSWWQRVEMELERASERLNPILVKEARQALKSRQFLVTMTLVLAFGWGWSMLGVALLSPGVYYAPGGRFMLVGYVLVLVAPVLIIIPFSAFRSLASEREDGTFELLSITSLTARQIVTGKLGSAVLQMLVYYSVLAPCIAFTYLLRGVDIITISLILCYTLLASILLSAAGLVLATASHARYWQVILSVLLLLGLLVVLIITSVLLIQLIVAGETTTYRMPDFWLGHVAVFSFYVSVVVLLILTAAAQISFASDNRSTKLRAVMLIQQALWVGWMTYVWIRVDDEGALFVMAAMAGLYWFLMGSLLTGEIAQLSPRVRRSLPQSFLGRMAFTWFNPGAGTGYTFAVSNLLTVVLTTVILGVTAQATGFSGAPRNDSWLLFGSLLVCYVTAYLGVGRIFTLLLRQIAPTGMMLSILVHLLLVLLGAAGPTLLQAWAQGYSNLDYSTWQFTNWAWTLGEASEGDLVAFPFVSVLVIGGAVGVFLLNLAFTAVEVEQVRSQTPQRVTEDNQAGQTNNLRLDLVSDYEPSRAAEP